MADKAFIELKFSSAVINMFDNFINEIVKDDMLYYSPAADHIRGNMSKTLHCTIFFGLNENVKSNAKLQRILNRDPIDTIKLGELSFINGYQNLYKVLVIDVLDKDGKLNSLYNKIESFALNEDPNFVVREFRPHLTLAYVQNDYVLPKDLPNLPEQIAVSEIKVSLVSEFNKEVNK